MKKLIFIVISLFSSLIVIGCAAQASASTPTKQEIDITYTSLLLPDAL